MKRSKRNIKKEFSWAGQHYSVWGMHIWLIKLVFQEIQGDDKYRNQSSGYLRGVEREGYKGASGGVQFIPDPHGGNVKIFHEAMHLIHVTFGFLGFILQ